MAKYVGSGTAYTYHVDFIVDGELVVPSSATIKITNNAGSVVGSYNNSALTLASGATGANVNISNVDNTPTLDNEIRYIEVKFTVNSIVYTHKDFYLLKDNVQFPLDPLDVLSVLGMTSGDVNPNTVDILSAYVSVKEDAGGLADVDIILQTGSSLLPTLIDTVKYKAAMMISIGAQNSLMQMEQSDNTLYRRFMEIDFKSMDKKISDLYQSSLYKLQGSPVAESPVISLVVFGTDPVTGA